MLVLSRKSGERIVIGNDIEIVVVGIQGDRVKLGFIAPNDVPIHRTEVYDRIHTELAEKSDNVPKNDLGDLTHRRERRFGQCSPAATISRVLQKHKVAAKHEEDMLDVAIPEKRA
jgi:carbon storage regulator